MNMKINYGLRAVLRVVYNFIKLYFVIYETKNCFKTNFKDYVRMFCFFGKIVVYFDKVVKVLNIL